MLNFWTAGAEGESSNIWQECLEDLKNRGLKEAVKRVYPKADFQVCILHKVRSALSKARKRHREELKEDLARIYNSPSPELFLSAFEEFKSKWEAIYPEIVLSWEVDLDSMMTFFKYPPQIKRYIYTSNSLERFIKEVRSELKIV